MSSVPWFIRQFVGSLVGFRLDLVKASLRRLERCCCLVSTFTIWFIRSPSWVAVRCHPAFVVQWDNAISFCFYNRNVIVIWRKHVASAYVQKVWLADHGMLVTNGITRLGFSIDCTRTAFPRTNYSNMELAYLLLDKSELSHRELSAASTSFEADWNMMKMWNRYWFVLIIACKQFWPR